MTPANSLSAEHHSAFVAESFDGTALPTGFEVAEARQARWRLSRTHWAPRVTVVRDSAGAPVAAALTAGRPYSPSRKIVDVLIAPGAAAGAAFSAAVEAAALDAPAPSEARPSPVLVRFEEHPVLAPLSERDTASLVALGFRRDADPLPSVASTRADVAEGVRSWSRWSPGTAPHRLAPYYGQTTDVTCGAVTALMALESAGLGRFSPRDHAGNRSWEIEFWRRATNMPACEPIGLAVATAGAISDAHLPLGQPRVVLSAEGPVLIEDFGAKDSFESKLRIELQAESLQKAQELGLQIERRWPEVREIHELVAAGNSVFLLIDLEPLIADPTPHWVLAHDVVRDDALVVSDPWVESAQGETWLDVSSQPITHAGVERIARWGNPAFRGIVVLPRIAD